VTNKLFGFYFTEAGIGSETTLKGSKVMLMLLHLLH